MHRARHPLKLLEYLASGLIVITNAVGEVEWHVKEGVNGFVCPAGAVDCLAGKVETLLGDPALVERVRAGVSSSVKGFSIEAIMPKWFEFLKL